MAHILSLRKVILRVELTFKRLNVIQLIQRAAHLLDTTFLPCPYLRTDVVEILYSRLMGELRYLQVKTRIVYKYHCIGAKFHNILLAESDVAQHGMQMCYHLDEAHDSKSVNMTYQRPANSLHTVA